MPASRKIHVTGTRPDIRVAMREVTLSGGEPPIRLYDTSGPYTDPDAHTDIKMGLTAMRLPWILGRADVDELPGPSSLYRRDRESDPALGGVRFASVRRPLRAKTGRRVTQMHCARRGEVTPRMEVVAVREGVAPARVRAEIARGRAILPADVNHPPTAPTVIERCLLVEVN